MNLRSDRLPRRVFALQNVKTKKIPACTMCETEEEAEKLLLGYVVHLKHHGKYKVVALMLTVDKG